MKKKIFVTVGVLFCVSLSANAGILSNIFGFNSGYNNGYYYNPSYVRYRNTGYYPYRYNNYYNRNYYSPNYRYNRYYNGYPNNYYYRPNVIRRTNVIRKSDKTDINIKPVSNSFSGLDKMEKKLLLQTYEYDSAKNRIERLEQKLFGAVQNGDLNQRFYTLKSVAKNYKAFDPNAMYATNQEYDTYSGYRPPIFTGSMGSGWQNTLWSNFKNQFIGMPTGMTPAMDPAYMDYFEAERALMGSGQDVDIRTNTGYHKSHTNRSSGAGVTILD